MFQPASEEEAGPFVRTKYPLAVSQYHFLAVSQMSVCLELSILRQGKGEMGRKREAQVMYRDHLSSHTLMEHDENKAYTDKWMHITITCVSRTN